MQDLFTTPTCPTFRPLPPSLLLRYQTPLLGYHTPLLKYHPNLSFTFVEWSQGCEIETKEPGDSIKIKSDRYFHPGSRILFEPAVSRQHSGERPTQILSAKYWPGPSSIKQNILIKNWYCFHRYNPCHPTSDDDQESATINFVPVESSRPKRKLGLQTTTLPSSTSSSSSSLSSSSSSSPSSSSSSTISSSSSLTGLRNKFPSSRKQY